MVSADAGRRSPAGRLAVFFSLSSALWALSCSEVTELPPCETEENCPDGELCLNGVCVPSDPCGAGIYRVENDVPPHLGVPHRTSPYVIRSLSEDPTAFASVVAPQGDRQLRIESDGTSRLFEIDFYVPDGSDNSPRNTAVFVEGRVRLVGPGGPCQAVIEMRVPTLDPDADPYVEVRFCLGAGAFGPSAGPTFSQVTLYSRLGVVRTTVPGRANSNTARSNAVSRNGSRCSTTSTTAAASMS